jgi:initiation factor 1A
MPKHKKGNNNTRRPEPKKLPIEYANEKFGQEYGFVTNVLGNCHFQVTNLKGEIKTASLCGTVKRGGRVKLNEVVLIEPLSDSTQKKYQIIFKYSSDHKKILEKEGILKTLIDPVVTNSEESEEEDLAAGAFGFANEVNQQQQNLNEAEQNIINENFIDRF